MRKIAILMPIAEQRGGAEVLLYALMRYGQDAGVEWVVVFFEEGPMVDDFKAMGVDTRVLPSGRLREVHRYMACVRRLAALIRREGVDLVFSWMGKAHLFGGPAARMTGIPAMVYQFGMPTARSLMDRLQTLMPTQGVVACSKTSAVAQQQLRPVRPTRVVYPCVELTHFDPNKLPAPDVMRRKLGLPTTGPLIGMVGRLQRWKGMHVLVEAMPRVLKSHPEAHCVIVGGAHALEPDYADVLKARIAALDLEDKVTLAGFQRNVPEWMQAMDVVVHASDHEPFGVVVIEAMALKKPVVAGAAAGPSEIITDGVDGLLAAYGDAEKLAGQILHLLDRPDLMRTMGEAARTRAQMFSPACYARQFIEAVCDERDGARLADCAASDPLELMEAGATS